MALPEVLIPSIVTIISVILGIFIGRYLSDRKENRKRSDELKKVKELIVRDFRTVRRIVNEQLREQKKDLENILNPDVKQDTHSERYLEPNVYFPYWPTLVNSGALMQLEHYEILTVQAVHDKILEALTNHKTHFRKTMKKMSDEKDEYKQIDIFLDIAKMTTDFYKLIIAMLDTMKIDWITFDKKEDFIKNTNEENKTANKPIVTPDGITIYPDGKRVDSHGTIL